MLVHTRLASVVQRLDRAIHCINHYPVGKYYQNLLSYPVDSAIHPSNDWAQVCVLLVRILNPLRLLESFGNGLSMKDTFTCT